MAIISVQDPVTGFSYPVKISGDQPTADEQQRIDSYISTRPKLGRDTATSSPELLEPLGLLPSTAYGLASSLAQVPEGMINLIEPGFGYTPGESWLGQKADVTTKSALRGIASVTGQPTEAFRDQLGMGLGSVASFLLPFSAGAKVASKIGLGLKGARAVGTGLTATQAVSLGAQDQMARIEQDMLMGREITPDQKTLSVLTGGAIGSLDVLPIYAPLGKLVRALRHVPPTAREEALKGARRYLMDAGKTALAEGGQEAVSNILQNWTQKGIYNPDVDYFEGAKDEAIVGGVAGAAVSFLVDALRGRSLKPFRQLEEDIARERQVAGEQAQRGRALIAEEAQQAEVASRILADIDSLEAKRIRTSLEEALAADRAGEDVAALRAALPPEEQAAFDILQQPDQRLDVRREPVAIPTASTQRGMFEPARGEGAVVPKEKRASAVVPQGEASKAKAQKIDLTPAQARQLEERLPEVVMDMVVRPDVGKPHIYVADPISLAESIERFYESATPKRVNPASRKTMLDMASALRGSVPEESRRPRVEPLRSEPQSITSLQDTRTPVQPTIEAGGLRDDDVRPMPVRPAESQEQAPPYEAPSYEAAIPDIVQKIRERLAERNLPDVDLTTEKLLDRDRLTADRPSVTHGQAGITKSGRVVIRLATHLNDPSLTNAQFEEALMRVMDHETIHALRDLGIITPREWEILSRAAGMRRVVIMKGGSLVTRSYTYLDREIARNRAMGNPLQAEEVAEEAVAEMFADHAAGRLKVNKEVSGIFRRIMQAIRSIVGGHRDAGFRDAARIFDSITSGEIGKRNRDIRRRAVQRADGGSESDGAGTRRSSRELSDEPMTDAEWSQAKRVPKDEARDLAFRSLADAQRGAPERAMIRAQEANGGGVVSYAAEHLGDLTHRMAEHGGRFGREFVEPKVRRVLKLLRSEYGFAREHEENMRANARARGTSPDEHLERANDALAKYAAEHRKLTVYNEMQRAARDAAVAFGERDWVTAERQLSIIEAALDDGTYESRALEFKPIDKSAAAAPTSVVVDPSRPVEDVIEDLRRMAVAAEAHAARLMGNESFRKWFRNSKVKRQDLPLVQFHMTSAVENFTSFRPMSHFGTLKAAEDRVKTKLWSLYNKPDIFDEMHGNSSRQNERIIPVVIRAESPFNYGSEDEYGGFGSPLDIADQIAQRIAGTEFGPNYNQTQLLDSLHHSMIGFLSVKERNLLWHADKAEVRRWAGKFVEDAVPKSVANIGNNADLMSALADYVAGRFYDEHTSRKHSVSSKGREINAILGIKRLLNAFGYDSVSYINTQEDPGSTSWITFEGNQVKSVFGTGFSDDPDMRRSSIAAPAINERSDVNQAIDRDGVMAYSLLNRKIAKFLSSVSTLAYGRNADQHTLDHINRTAEDRAQWFVTHFQDRMVPIGKIIDDLRAKGLHVSDAMDTYRKEMIYHGKLGSDLADIERSYHNPLITAVGNVKLHTAEIERLRSASELFKMYEELYGGEGHAAVEAYLYARHALRGRNPYIAKIDPQNQSGSGMTDAEAQAIIDWHDTMSDKGAQRAIDKAVKIFDEMIKDTTDTNVRHGLIPEDAPMLGMAFYAPLRGKLVDDMESDFDAGDPGYAAMPRRRPLLGASGREGRRALGRDDYADNILANAITQNITSHVRGRRNEVGQSLLRLIRGSGGQLNGSLDIIETEGGFTLKPHTRALVNGKVRQVPENYRSNLRDYIVVKEGGHETVVRVADPRIAQAMNGSMNPQSAGGLVRALGKLNRWLANINTSWSPDFVLSNPSRDLQTALYNMGQYDIEGLSGAWRGNLVSATKGIRRYLQDPNDTSPETQMFRDFIKAGGRNSLNEMGDLRARIKNIDDVLKDMRGATVKTRAGQMKAAFHKVADVIEKWNTVAENATRVAFFKALRDKGVTPDRAAAAARDLTVNFAKGGEYKSVLNSAYLFFNASLQGSVAMANATIRRPKSMIPRLAKIAAAGFLWDMLNSLLSDEDEDGTDVYDKINDYTLEHNIIVPTGGLLDRGYLRVPLPYGLHAIWNSGRALSRYVRGGYSIGEASGSMLGSVIEFANPFGDSFDPINEATWSRAATMALPTAVDPIIQFVSNEDYAGRPIYKDKPQFGVAGPDAYRHWETTNPILTWLTKSLNDIGGGTPARSAGLLDISPDTLEFWIEFASGGFGQSVARIAGIGVEAYNVGVLGEAMQEDMLNNIPVVRRFTTQVTEREDVGSFVQKRDEVLLAEKDLKAAIAAGDMAWAADVRRKYAAELALLPRVKALNNARNRLRERQRLIEANTRIPEGRKRDMLASIDERISKIVAAANKIMADL